VQPTFETLIGPILKEVSRSFYLTLRILPHSLRGPLSLAYLLARASDTIADTKVIASGDRRRHLDALREMIKKGTNLRVVQEMKAQLMSHQASAGEKALLMHMDDCLFFLHGMNDIDRYHITNVLMTIIRGQDLDLQRFKESSDELVALKTKEELDEYTYLVAGCVGEFWTHMCLVHLPSLKNWKVDSALENGTNFGKGLQLINILRDIPQDLANGRCYLPEEELRRQGLSPRDLLNPLMMDQLRPVYDQWLARANGYLDAGWAYTLAYPRREVRMRLACAWPILIGVRTLEFLRDPARNPLTVADRIRVDRKEVKSMIVSSLVRCFSNRSLNRYYQSLRTRTEN